MVGIYKITNPNGKVYIGQSLNINKRWKNYIDLNQYSIGPKLYNSLKKYGWDKHIKEIIEECPIEQLNEREIYWKQQILNIFNNNWSKVLFCELYDRGGGPKSKETKKNQSIGLIKSYKKRESVWKGKKRPEHSEYMKKYGTGFKYIRTPLHNEIKINAVKKAFKERGKEIGKKISEAKKGKGFKSIKCNETNIIYNSITECSKKMNISCGILCSFVRGKYAYPSIKGYTFSYT